MNAQAVPARPAAYPDVRTAVKEITLLFFTVGGVGMAVESSEVKGMMTPGDAINSGVPVARLDLMLGLHHARIKDGAPSKNEAPTKNEISKGQGNVLVIEGESPYGLAVDGFDEISTVGMDGLRPMPALAVGKGLIWGACLREEKVILLIDLKKAVENNI